MMRGQLPTRALMLMQMPNADADADAARSDASWDQCTQVAFELPEIAQEVGVGPSPTALGGTVADGTYVLSRYEVFGATALTSDAPSGAIVIASPAIQIRSAQTGVSGTFRISGTSMTNTIECNCARAVPRCSREVVVAAGQSFTATANKLVFIRNYINGGNAVVT
jgi:hypothetical protein